MVALPPSTLEASFVDDSEHTGTGLAADVVRLHPRRHKARTKVKRKTHRLTG
jgi:hypothetical protein